MKFNDTQKAATVILSLGADVAAAIYKYLNEDEIEKVTYEIAKIQRINAEDADTILKDFYSLCLTHKVVTEGGIPYAQSVLEKAFGAKTASILIERVSSSIKSRAFEFLRKADTKSIVMAIQNENPQTIALILSYTRPEQTATVISELPKELRTEVVNRIALMERTSPEVINHIEKTLEKKFSTLMSTEYTEVGGINFIAEIMNNMDRSNEKYIFGELYKKDPKLADTIREKMFVFEDILSLDPISIQRFLRDVDSKDLVIALKASTDEVKEIILNNMSKRMGETIIEDMAYVKNVKVREAEEAQQKIVAIIRKLEENGEITISKGRDEFIS